MRSRPAKSPTPSRLHDLVVEQLAARVVRRRRAVGERVREVAGGEEQRVAPELLGAAAHELAQRAVLGVGADDREATRSSRRAGSSAARGRPSRGTSPSSGTTLQLAVVAGQRQQELGERHVVVVAEGDLAGSGSGRSRRAGAAPS